MPRLVELQDEVGPVDVEGHYVRHVLGHGHSVFLGEPTYGLENIERQAWANLGSFSLGQLSHARYPSMPKLLTPTDTPDLVSHENCEFGRGFHIALTTMCDPQPLKAPTSR